MFESVHHGLRYALLLRAARRHETEVVGIYLSRLGLKIYARIKTRVVDRERYWCHSLMYYCYLGLGGVGIHIAQRLNRTGACHAHYAVIEGMIYTTFLIRCDLESIPEEIVHHIDGRKPATVARYAREIVYARLFEGLEI